MKINIESKYSHLAENSDLKNKALSYIDINKSLDAGSMSIMALAESSSKNPYVCETILASVKKTFTSNFSAENDKNIDESETMSSKITALFNEANSKLVSLRKTENNLGASLNVGVLDKNILYLGVSGNLNTHLFRDSILYNLHLRDNIFKPLKQNSPKDKIIMMGTTIIPQIDTFKVQLRAGDILLFLSSGISENLDDKEILMALKFSETREQAIDKILSASTGRAGKTQIALVVLSSENNSNNSVSKSNDTGTVLAELPPELPPSLYQEEIELRRSDYDYYNTSQIDHSHLPEEQEHIESDSLHKKEQYKPGKALLFFLSLIITLALGAYWINNSNIMSAKFKTIWEIRTEIDLNSVSWKNNEIKLKGNIISYKNNSDLPGILVIHPRNKFYDCEISINTAERLDFKSKQSNSTQNPNEITLEKNQIYVNTNLTGTTDVKKINEIVEENGKKYYITTFKMKNLKEKLFINSKSMNSLRIIEIDLTKPIK